MCENYDNFVGTTYTTSRGGILTVVNSNGKNGQEKRYFCILFYLLSRISR
ncbi:hypothetical protein KLEP7_gp152 [Pseudaeromonas phage vB_PpeM_ KLEP7]|nr:hypothetical protein KLEP7_gp152 [Pseudaeromonas phage vB_PpeM_ KLEP7]